MYSKLEHELISLTLLSILLANCVTFAILGVMPAAEAAHNKLLFVSAENVQSNNTFAGPQVIEVVVDDDDISKTDVVQGEPDVTVNGKKIRMAQATDGKWYGYFADRTQAQLADDIALMGLPGKGLDFGAFCNNAATGFGPTFTDTAGIASARTLPGNSQGTATLGTCGSKSPGATALLNNVVREPEALNPGNGGVSVGQIGFDEDAWPIIQLFNFTIGGTVTVNYNKGGSTQNTTLTFDKVPSNLITTSLDKSTYQLGAQVQITITDPQLNVDPTDEDSWTWGKIATTETIFYQAFDENGVNDANGGTGLVNLKGNLTNLMFVDNGRVEVNLTANGTTVAEFDTNTDQRLLFLSDGSQSYTQIISFVESEQSNGVFVNYDKLGDSNLDILANAENGKSATIWYSDLIKSIKVQIPNKDKFHILFKSGAYTPDPGLNIPAIKASAKDGFVHFLIQFDDLPNSDDKITIAGKGINILDYVTGNTYIASAKVNNVDNLNDLSALVKWAGPFNPDYKIAHALKVGNIPDWSRKNNQEVLDIYFHKDVNLKSAKDRISTLGGQSLAAVLAIPSITATFDLDKINDIAQEDIVQYVDVTMPPLAPANNVARESAYVTPLAGPLYDLRGRGVTILIYDEGLVGGHDDFIGRLIENDTNTLQVGIAHSVLVGGIVGGSGSLSTGGQLAGMAPEIKIRTFAPPPDSDRDFWNRTSDLEADVLTVRNRIDLATMSMAHNVHAMNDENACQYLGDYSEAAVLIDEIVTGNIAQSLGPPLIFFEAVGNERINSLERCNTEYGTISSPATAKNSIAVGATKSDDAGSMSTVSSWGPTKDGRIKPDITAPSCRDDTRGPMSTNFNNRYDWSGCRTSFATPIASGATALLIEEWKKIHGVESRPLPHTVKAILIHTAIDRGNPGPDYQYGWGALNATSAINLVKANGNGPLIIVDQINFNGDIVSFTYTSDGSKEVKATLVWDDPHTAAVQTHTLINDLDLELIAPGTTQPILPFILNPNSPATHATRATPNDIDKINNVEMVISDSPRNGVWTVNVKGTTVADAPQQYTLIISDTIPEAGATTGGGNTDPSITSTGPTTATEGTLYSYNVDAEDPGDTLSFILDVAPAGMTIDATTGEISWTPTSNQVGPNTVTVRVIDSGGLFDTQTFTVIVADSGSTEGTDGCLIATAAFGSEMAPQIQQLRELRDNTLLKTTSGSAFMAGFNTVYYSFSPTIANWERQNPVFKEAVKITITPLLTTLSILNYVDIDSEAKMLGYGIGIILLNIGMYFVAPAFIIMRLRQSFSFF